VDVDGRTARRDRNREAVLDAVHELFVERAAVPTVESVAERSGVSLRSIYRYFPDVSQLMTAALARRVARAEPLFHLSGLGEGALKDRVARFVDHRLDIYELAAPTIRAAFTLSGSAVAIQEQIERRRELLRDQAAQHFAPELAGCDARRAADVLAAIEVLGQFESLELLRVQRGLSVEESRRVLVAAVTALLRSCS
jgi:AcrR family transcriptional regulator